MTLTKKLPTVLSTLLLGLSIQAHSCDLNPADYNLPNNVEFVVYYEGICGFNEGLIAVTDSKKLGFADEQGNIDMPIIYDNGDIFFRDGFIRAMMDGKIGVINHKNKIIVPIDYDLIQRFEFSSGLIEVAKDGQYGIFNQQGELMIPVQYDKILTQEDYIYLQQEGKWGIFDHAGNEIIPISLDYDYIGDFNDGLANVKTHDGKYGFIDITGKLVIDSQFDYAHGFDNGLAQVGIFRNPTDNANNNSDNYPVNLPSQNSTTTSGEFWSQVEHSIQSKQYGLINTQGMFVVPAIYDDLRGFDYNDNFYVVSKNNKQGIIDNKSSIIVPIKYDTVSNGLTYFDDELTIRSAVKVKLNDRYGLYDEQGNLVIPVEYDYAMSNTADEQFIEVEKDGKKYTYDWSGNLITNKK